jgi:hypothetical protein
MQCSFPLRFSWTVALNFANPRECGHHAYECQTYNNQPPPSIMPWADIEIQPHILLHVEENGKYNDHWNKVWHDMLFAYKTSVYSIA